jgi:hypothetical protein
MLSYVISLDILYLIILLSPEKSEKREEGPKCNARKIMSGMRGNTEKSTHSTCFDSLDHIRRN